MDIVGRLREACLDKDNMPRMDSERWFPVGLAREATAEIDRLRSERLAFATESEERKAEIERLTAEVASLKASCGYEAANQLTADNERLRAALTDAERWFEDEGMYGQAACCRAILKDTTP